MLRNTKRCNKKRDNPEKPETQGTQDEEKNKSKTQHNMQTRYTSSHKQLEAKTNRTSFLYINAINHGDCPRSLFKLISAPELSKHLTTSHSPSQDAANNGDSPSLSHKLISAPELSKHLKTSQCPDNDAINNGDHPLSLHKLISAPELSKH
jgi:hypothetical protein